MAKRERGYHSIFVENVPPELHEALRAKLKASGRTLRGLVLAAFREYVAGDWTPGEVEIEEPAGRRKRKK